MQKSWINILCTKLYIALYYGKKEVHFVTTGSHCVAVTAKETTTLSIPAPGVWRDNTLIFFSQPQTFINLPTGSY